MKAVKSLEEVQQLLVVETRLGRAPDLHQMVADSGALLRGHFGLQSGHHSELFIRFAQLGRNREAIAAVAETLVDELGDVPFDVVLCPESSGYFLGQAIAARCRKELVVAAINTLRQPTSALRRGVIAAGSSVLLVNDVVTSGGSLKPLLSVAESAASRVAGIAMFASLRPQQLARFRSEHSLAGAHLVSATWNTFAPADCPICKTGESLIPAAEFN